MAIGEKVYAFWRKPVCFHWRKMVWFSLPFTIGDKGKILCLQAYCKQYNIDSNRCIAVGDGASDIPLFEFCEGSIAINYSEATIGKACYYLKTDDLSDILDLIIS